MWEDPIIAELHRIRCAQAAEFEFDIKAIVKALRQQQDASGRQVLSFVENGSLERKA